MAMFEGVADLTLAMLNEATQAWAEFDHNLKIHSETGEAPITRFLAGPDVTRPCPDSDALRLAFTRTDHRMQRKSDGTVVIEGRRFEILTAVHKRRDPNNPARPTGLTVSCPIFWVPPQSARTRRTSERSHVHCTG